MKKLTFLLVGLALGAWSEQAVSADVLGAPRPQLTADLGLGKLMDIKPGQTTYEQALALMGKPAKETVEKGVRTVYFAKNPGIADADIKASNPDIITMMFDERGILNNLSM